MLVLPRPVWLVLGVAAGLAAATVSSPWLLCGWLAPDLGVLAGGLRLVDQRGVLRPAAARGYNATHALPAPSALAVAALLIGSSGLLGVSLLWLCHIAVDRAVGYTLRPVHA